jgi:hypothetical protein
MINVKFKLATQTPSRLSLETRPAVRTSSIAMSSRSFRYMEILPAFVELCRRLESSCGVRFVPSKLLIDMAEKADAFRDCLAGQRAAA